MQTWVCAVVALCVCAIGVVGGCRGGEGGTDGARRVVVYVSVDDVVARPILEAFEEETGIAVEMRGDTEATKNTGLVQRLRAERESPRADVFWSSEVFLTIKLAEEGLLRPFEHEMVADWPGRLRDEDRLWHAFAQRARVIAYNTERVPEEEAPRELLELMDERWRGRVVMARPQFGTTRGHMAALDAVWSSGGFEHWLRAMQKNGLRLVDGNATVVRMVAGGEADVGLTDTDDVWAGQREGWPVGLTYARHRHPVVVGVSAGAENRIGVLTIPNTVSLIEGGPNPEAGEALAAFLLSPRVERMLAESDSHNIPIRPELAAEFPEYAVPDPMDLSYEAIADHMDEAMRLCDEVLR